MTGSKQQNAASADEATQGGDAPPDFWWAEATVWTKRIAVGAGQRRQRRQMVLIGGQGSRARYAGGGLDQGPGQQRRGGRGWAERRKVRGSGGKLSDRTGDGGADGVLPTAGRQAGRHPERRWQDKAVGHSDGQRSHRPTGGPARDRTDFRGWVPRRELWLPSGTRMP